MADRREIYALLLNAYLERLSGKGRDGEPDGPFWDAAIEAKLHPVEGQEPVLALDCKYFALQYPATAQGMLEARRAIDELALLAAGNAHGLGDELVLHPEHGYHLPGEGTQALARTDEGETDGQV